MEKTSQYFFQTFALFFEIEQFRLERLNKYFMKSDFEIMGYIITDFVRYKYVVILLWNKFAYGYLHKRCPQKFHSQEIILFYPCGHFLKKYKYFLMMERSNQRVLVRNPVFYIMLYRIKYFESISSRSTSLNNLKSVKA